MKIKVNKIQLESSLSKSIPFLDNKDMSSISSNILIVADNDIITVSATDYEIGLKTTFQTLGIIENGTAIVNGKKILDIIKILKKDDIDIEKKGEFLHISQGRSKFKIALFNEVFPDFPNFDKTSEISINSSSIINAFRLITPTIDTNNPKYEFNAALLNIKKDSIDFVSTDVKRLSIVNIHNETNDEMQIIIPRKAIVEIQKLFFDDIKIYLNNVYMMIESDNSLFFTKLVNGKFPDYSRIIPQNINHDITLNKNDAFQCLKQINTVSNEVIMTISNNRIIFSSVGDKNNEAITDMNVDYVPSEEISISFNSKFLLDFLNIIYDIDFTIGINDPYMPFILSSNDLKTLVMPTVL